MTDYSIDDLIGMLNLGVILARDRSSNKVEIPKDAAIELRVYLETLKQMQQTLQEEA